MEQTIVLESETILTNALVKFVATKTPEEAQRLYVLLKGIDAGMTLAHEG